MATTNAVEAPSVGLLDWLRAISRPSLLALGVGVLAVLSAVVTYAMVTGLVPYNPTPTNFVTLLLINLSLGVSLGGLIAWRLARLWSARQSGLAGRQAACAPGGDVQRDRGRTGHSCRDLRGGYAQSRHRGLVFDAREDGARQRGRRRPPIMIEQRAASSCTTPAKSQSSIEHDPHLFDENKQVRLSLMMEKLAIMTNDRGLAGIVPDRFRQGSELGSKSAKLALLGGRSSRAQRTSRDAQRRRRSSSMAIPKPDTCTR